MKKILLLFALSILLVGCVTINEEMLRKVTITPPQKPATIVEIKSGELIILLNGESKDKGTSTTVMNAKARGMMLRWMSKDLIADYDFPGALKKDPDYTIIFSGTRNEEASMAQAVLSGLTFMIIPVKFTLIYDLNVEFINNHSQKHYFVKVKNGFTTWMDIFLLPALPFSMIGSVNSTHDMADYLYDELRKQGAFSDSGIP